MLPPLPVATDRSRRDVQRFGDGDISQSLAKQNRSGFKVAFWWPPGLVFRFRDDYTDHAAIVLCYGAKQRTCGNMPVVNVFPRSLAPKNSLCLPSGHRGQAFIPGASTGARSCALPTQAFAAAWRSLLTHLASPPCLHNRHFRFGGCHKSRSEPFRLHDA